MKKSILRMLMSLMLLLGAASAASAADRFYMDAVNIAPGETATLAFCLDNDRAYYAFQADIALPQGLEFVTKGNGEAEASLSPRFSETLMTNFLADGRLRVVAYSFPLAPIEGNSGELLYVKVKASNGFAGGTLSVSDISVSDADNQNVDLPDFAVVIGNEHHNAFYLPNFSIPVGKTTTVGAVLENDVVFSALQTDLYLPAGLSLVEGSMRLTARGSASHTVATQQQADGAIRILSYSMAGGSFAGNDGVLLEFDLAADAGVAGVSIVELKNQIFTTDDTKEYTLPNSSATVTAQWESYTLTYLVDGEVYKTYSLAYGATITPEAAPTKEGHTFSGWSEIPATMPAHDVTIEGTFAVNSYTLTYLVDGEVYKTYTLAYGTAITPEPAPEKEGYTFSSWSEIPATMPAHDVTVTGSFAVNSYTLTYLVDGETYKTETLAYGTAITPEPAPTKEGHTFSGWSEIPATMPAHDVTVTGSFSVNSYTLTYLVDSEVYKTYSLAYGEAITPEPAPTKEGYTFSDWSDIPATMPAHDVIVEGSFSVNSYTLSYIVDGETYKTETLAYGAEITPAAAPTKEGYTFSGWNEIPATMPAHDVTVTGSFAVNSYTLTYLVDGEVYKTYSMAYGTAITPEPEPTKEGYTFSGWGDIPATMPAHDVTVTGTFSVNSGYKLTYLVDGQPYKTYSLTYGEAITPEPEPVREGYTFSGWSEIPAMMPAHDVTVTGTFAVNSYTLTYLVAGEVYKTYTLAYGTAITPEPEPTKEGHTFSGWNEIPATMPAHDVTVTGTFAVNSYTLTYLVDGEVYKTYSLAYGATITPEPAPTKEGYTFSGWGDIPATMPAHDVTVSGTFSVNSGYKLTYLVDGQPYKTYSLAYGEAITPEPEPIREGYTFSGWSEIPATMPAHDVTVMGSFAVNSYTLTWMVNNTPYLTETLDYGAIIVEPEAPVLEGYDFDGWIDVPATMPAHDLTIYSSYTLGIEDLTADGGCVDIYSVSGLKLYGNVRLEDGLRKLPTGIYIVGGKKTIKR